MIHRNYHVHTYRCNHAKGRDRDYVEAAIQAGFTEIAFTDHSPWPLLPQESGMIRMKLAMLPDYVNSLRQLREEYKDRIAIKIGLECEYFADRIGWLKDTIKEYELDFVILGNHFHEYEAQARFYSSYQDKKNLLSHYLSDSLAAIESGVYAYFAHPDIFVRSLTQWDEEAIKVSRIILEACKKTGMPVEYNLGGVRNHYYDLSYPYPEFWKIASEIGNEVMIGIDAHNPDDFQDKLRIKEAISFLKSIGIKVSDRKIPSLREHLP
jgi:histidinol-phosphatase (PHP family)